MMKLKLTLLLIVLLFTLNRGYSQTVLSTKVNLARCYQNLISVDLVITAKLKKGLDTLIIKDIPETILDRYNTGISDDAGVLVRKISITNVMRTLDLEAFEKGKKEKAKIEARLEEAKKKHRTLLREKELIEVELSVLNPLIETLSSKEVATFDVIVNKIQTLKKNLFAKEDELRASGKVCLALSKEYLSYPDVPKTVNTPAVGIEVFSENNLEKSTIRLTLFFQGGWEKSNYLNYETSSKSLTLKINSVIPKDVLTLSKGDNTTIEFYSFNYTGEGNYGELKPIFYSQRNPYNSSNGSARSESSSMKMYGYGASSSEEALFADKQNSMVLSDYNNCYSVQSNKESPNVTLLERTFENVSLDRVVNPALSKDVFGVIMLDTTGRNKTGTIRQFVADNSSLDCYIDKRFIMKSVYREDYTAIPMIRDNRFIISKEEIATEKKSNDGRAFKITITSKSGSTESLKIVDQIPLARGKEVVITPRELSGGVIDPTTNIITWEKSIKSGEVLSLVFSYSVK